MTAQELPARRFPAPTLRLAFLGITLLTSCGHDGQAAGNASQSAAKLDGAPSTVPETSPAPSMLPPGAHIVLPTVQARGVTLDKAIELIRGQARERDHEKKGVEMIIQPGTAAGVTADLAYKDISIPDLMERVARLYRCRLTTSGTSYTLTPDGTN